MVVKVVLTKKFNEAEITLLTPLYLVMKSIPGIMLPQHKSPKDTRSLKGAHTSDRTEARRTDCGEHLICHDTRA